MKDLITKLASYIAPSGTETALQNALLDLVRDVADEAFVDTLGNAIARKHGSGPHVMLAAHADEVGAMIIHIQDDGFLRLVSVGNVKPYTLIGRHIQFANDVIGVVGCEANVKLEDVDWQHLYVDIGATSADDARGRVHIGMSGVILEPVRMMDEQRMAGRGLDNRVGCAIAVEAFRSAAEKGRNVSVVFSAQQAVGARGAKTAAFRLQPDLALIIDAVCAGDMPEAQRMSIRLGGGPAVKIMDATAIVPVDVKNMLVGAAGEAGIQIQYEVWPGGQTDAGSIQLSTSGVRIGGISYPARYVGGPSTVVDLRDISDTLRLVNAVVDRATGDI